MIPMSPALVAQIDELERLRDVRGDTYQVSREQGEILTAFALAHKARTIVEIGTSYGFSGLWWLAALSITDGHLHTIDVLEKKFNASKEAFAAAGVANRVTNYLGEARTILPKMPDNIDIIFIDADKPSTRTYFDLLWPKLRPGGSVLTDNVISHRDQMADFVRYARARSDAYSTLIPTHSGVEWTLKLQ